MRASYAARLDSRFRGNDGVVSSNAQGALSHGQPRRSSARIPRQCGACCARGRRARTVRGPDRRHHGMGHAVGRHDTREHRDVAAGAGDEHHGGAASGFPTCEIGEPCAGAGPGQRVRRGHDQHLHHLAGRDRVRHQEPVQQPAEGHADAGDRGGGAWHHRVRLRGATRLGARADERRRGGDSGWVRSGDEACLQRRARGSRRGSGGGERGCGRADDERVPRMDRFLRCSRGRADSGVFPGHQRRRHRGGDGTGPQLHRRAARLHRHDVA